MHYVGLLKELRRGDRAVLIKRGMSVTIDETIKAADYVRGEGNARVILCERGIRTFEPRLSLHAGSHALRGSPPVAPTTCARCTASRPAKGAGSCAPTRDRLAGPAAARGDRARRRFPLPAPRGLRSALKSH